MMLNRAGSGGCPCPSLCGLTPGSQLKMLGRKHAGWGDSALRSPAPSIPLIVWAPGPSSRRPPPSTGLAVQTRYLDDNIGSNLMPHSHVGTRRLNSRQVRSVQPWHLGEVKPGVGACSHNQIETSQCVCVSTYVSLVFISIAARMLLWAASAAPSCLSNILSTHS